MVFYEGKVRFDGSDPALTALGGCNGVLTGLPREASEALADPIVQVLMAADRVDAKGIAALLRRAAARLAGRDPETESADSAAEAKAMLLATRRQD
jgi:hypothetical protein